MQTKETPSIYFVLLSRKFWMAAIGLVLILVTAWNQDPYPADAVVTAIMGVVGAFIAATAWEDTARAKAAAPPVTTVSTPGGSDVTVIAPSDANAPVPPQPMLGRMGG